MSNMKTITKLIATLNTVEDVKSVLVAERAMKYPRKGVINACLRRVGELYLGRTVEEQAGKEQVEVVEETVEETVEEQVVEEQVHPFIKVLERLQYPHKVTSRTVQAMDVAWIDEHVVHMSMNVAYYKAMGERGRRFMASLVEAADRLPNCWSRLMKPPRGRAYLRIRFNYDPDYSN